jgi:hypothetical protein
MDVRRFLDFVVISSADNVSFAESEGSPPLWVVDRQRFAGQPSLSVATRTRVRKHHDRPAVGFAMLSRRRSSWTFAAFATGRECIGLLWAMEFTLTGHERASIAIDRSGHDRRRIIMRASRCALLLLSVLAVCATSAAEESRSVMPPGVNASNWISLGDSHGFVIRDTLRAAKPAGPLQRPTPLPGGGSIQPRSREVMGELAGYFVVKRSDGWYRLSDLREPKVVPVK